MSETAPTMSSEPPPHDKIKALMQQGRFEPALTEAEKLTSSAPDDGEAWYMKAVCHRYLNQPDAASDALSRLIALEPEYGRAFQELGHLKRAHGDTNAAIVAYGKAVEFNPGLVASWVALSELEAGRGDAEAAARARAQADRLKALPPELISVTSFIHEGKLLKAEKLCRAFLQKNRQHVEAMRLLADIGARFQVLDDAEFLLESALEFEPENVLVHMDYVNVLHKRQRYQKAKDEAAALIKKQPDNPAFEVLYANECAAIGDHDAALKTYESALKKTGGNPSIYLVQGHAFKAVGRHDDAVEAYRAAFRTKPDLGEAFFSLANLKTYRFTDDEVALMTKAATSPATGLSDKFHLCFALGKAFEDAGDFDRAFAFYEQGNALKKAQLRYSADRMDQEFALQKSVCTAELMAGLGGQGHDAPDPIFIVGLPRAGSTLIEQILASHSRVDGTIELPNILALAHTLNGRRQIDDDAKYPGVLADLTPDQLKRLGEKYIEETKIYRSGAPFFTDKMPNNFRHLGLIHAILPNAKIIDARRAPLACCFSGFKQLFAEGQEFTYGLEEVGRYYRGYVDLMDHWDQVLPGKILRVQYEDVVEDLEGQVRRLLTFLDLPFEDACVSFHETERTVQTASSEQVRQPIFTSGVDQWKKFEAHLDPLKHALGQDLIGR